MTARVAVASVSRMQPCLGFGHREAKLEGEGGLWGCINCGLGGGGGLCWWGAGRIWGWVGQCMGGWEGVFKGKRQVCLMAINKITS